MASFAALWNPVKKRTRSYAVDIRKVIACSAIGSSWLLGVGFCELRCFSFQPTRIKYSLLIIMSTAYSV